MGEGLWDGGWVTLDHDFVTTITDVGVCYTFNSGINQSARVVTEHGKYLNVLRRPGTVLPIM